MSMSDLPENETPSADAPTRDALRNRIISAVRRIHHYGDPPDVRLEDDVTGDLADILDLVDQYAELARLRERGSGTEERIRVLEQNLGVANERYDFWLGFARDLGKTIGWPPDRQMREAIPEIASAWVASGRDPRVCICGELCIPDEMSTCRRVIDAARAGTEAQ